MVLLNNYGTGGCIFIWPQNDNFWKFLYIHRTGNKTNNVKIIYFLLNLERHSYFPVIGLRVSKTVFKVRGMEKIISYYHICLLLVESVYVWEFQIAIKNGLCIINKKTNYIKSFQPTIKCCILWWKELRVIFPRIDS